jgi:ferrous iron transport protein A
MINDQYSMPKMLMPLSLVPANRSVVLYRVRGGCGLSAHLAAMGLLPGVRIDVRRNDHRGPVLIGLNDSRLALGRGMAQKLSVHEE